MTERTDMLVGMARGAYKFFISALVKLVLVAALISGWNLASGGHPVVGFLLSVLALACLDLTPWLQKLLGAREKET